MNFPVNFFKNILKNTLDLSNDKKSDMVFVIAFSLIFVLMCILTWGRLGDPIVDCGRELYIPQAILSGKVLIKDIFTLYNPLSYQINAVFFKIFGIHISILYVLGIITSYLILLFVYLTARTIFKPLESFAVVLTTMTIGVFNFWISNYIFPYSYAIIYSFLGIIAAIFFGIRAIQARNDKSFNFYIYLAFLSLSFSIANKFDFIFIIIPLVAIPFLLKKFKLKEYFYCFVILAVFLILSYGILLLQGLYWGSFFEHFNTDKRFFQVDATICFYKFFFLLSPIKYLIVCTYQFLFFSLITILNYFLIKNNLKLSLKIVKYIFFILIILLNLKILNTYNGAMTYFFCWIVLFNFIFLFLHILTNIKDKEFWNKDSNLIITFILFCTILSTVKTALLIDINGYSSYIIGLIILSLMIVLLKIIPPLIKIKDAEQWNQIFSIFFIILSISFASLNLSKIYNKHEYLGYGNEKLYVSKNNSYIINKTVEYLKQNTPQNATCLVLPEGPIINFLSDRKTMDKYYHLIPNHIEALGEDKIIKDLQAKPPEYILINDRNTEEYGAAYFCHDYAKKICEFVNSNYTQEKYFSVPNQERHWYNKDLTSMTIYKLKNNK